MWSPGATRVTPGPTSSTTPAPSCPSTIGQPARDLALQDVQVRVAEPGVRVADEDLALAWPGEVELLDLEGLADLVNHSCGRLHSVQSSKSAHT